MIAKAVIPQSVLDRFNNGELVAAVVQDVDTKEVLMMAWVNQEALEKVFQLRLQHFGAEVEINFGLRDQNQEIAKR